jgi:dienelactone hydrolase
MAGNQRQENMKPIFALTACLWASGCGVASAQTLEVTPSQILVDESAVIRATGLNPNEPVSIEANLEDGDGHAWTSQAEFLADAQGVVDTSSQAPMKGSYHAVSAMGLVWSMKPAEKHVAAYRPPRDLGTQVTEFRLVRNGQPVAKARLEQLMMAQGVKQITLEGQLHGILFLPNTSGPHPGVLELGGSEGGLPRGKAAWLASRGYVALALAYFRYDDLPPRLEGIPLEYFGNALAWLMQRPEVTPGRVAVMGTSRGGELALQLASMFPQIKAAVAYVPASVRFPACCGNTRVPYAWTWKGQPLSYVLPRFMRNPMAMMSAAIPVEQMRGPVLLISGEDDGVWPSEMMTRAIVARLKQTHFSYAVQHLSYAHAGHRAGRPEVVPTWHGRVVNPTSGREENLGGSVEGDAQSSLDAIPKVLEFLRSGLQGGG